METRESMTRTERYNVAKRAEQLGLISWRQVERVIAGNVVNVRGITMTPETLRLEVEKSNDRF